MDTAADEAAATTAARPEEETKMQEDEDKGKKEVGEKEEAVTVSKEEEGKEEKKREDSPGSKRRESDHEDDEDDDEKRQRRRNSQRGSPEPAAAADAAFKVDREKTCPLLLRVFPRMRGHNRLDDYRGSRLPPNELQMYTWMDATLKELSILVKEANMQARRKGTKFLFAAVYFNARGVPMRRELGVVTNGEKGAEDEKTLKSVNFRIGDYLDLGIISPDRRGPPGGDRRTIHDRLGGRSDRGRERSPDRFRSRHRRDEPRNMDPRDRRRDYGRRDRR